MPFQVQPDPSEVHTEPMQGGWDNPEAEIEESEDSGESEESEESDDTEEGDEPEESEESEEDDESEDSEESDDSDDEESGERPTPRAQKRIQQLASQKRQLEDRLATVLEQLNGTMSYQQQAQQQQWQQQQQQQLAYRQQQERQQLINDLKQRGFDETNLSHQLALETALQQQQWQQQWQQQMQQQLLAQQQAAQQQQRQAMAQEYVSGMRSAIETETRGMGLSSETSTALLRMAAEQSSAYGLNDPTEAARRAIELYGSLVGELPKKRKVRDKPDAKLTRASSMRGAKSGRRKGDHVSGKKRTNRSSNSWNLASEVFGDGGDGW